MSRGGRVPAVVRAPGDSNAEVEVEVRSESDVDEDVNVDVDCGVGVFCSFNNKAHVSSGINDTSER